MKVVGGYILREVLEEWILLPVGENAVNRRQMSSLSECGAFLWVCLKNDCTQEELLSALKSRYPTTDIEVLKADMQSFLSELSALNLLEVTK